jgi:hypothetical protein
LFDEPPHAGNAALRITEMRWEMSGEGWIMPPVEKKKPATLRQRASVYSWR